MTAAIGRATSLTGGGAPRLTETARSRLTRRPAQGRHDRAIIDAIIDEALVCHVGLNDANGAPVVVPASPWRIGDWLYLHGSTRSRLHAHLAAGSPVCVSIAIVDALVFARSALRHSLHYRSVMLFGSAEPVEAPEQKTAALLALIDKLSPGRSPTVRPPSQGELDATAVTRIPITEGAAKIADAPPLVPEFDRVWPAWSGSVPVALRAGSPLPTQEAAGLAPPRLPGRLHR